MNINSSEIDLIEEAGLLHGNSVKLIRTKGGFWIAVTKLKNKPKEEAIAAGSHPAIVRFNLEKNYPEFQPAMMKSELVQPEAIVDRHSHFLSEELRKSGHDIYSIQNGNEISFVITKQNLKVDSVDSFIDSDVLNIKELNISKKFTRALAGAATEKALASGAKKIKIGNK